MRISATKAVIILLVAAILVTGAVYLYVRTQQSSIALEQNVEVLGVEVNKRTAELVSVTLRNNGPTLILEGASLYKIQSGITLVSSKFSPPIILYTGNVTKVPISYQLDKEGADYFLYLFTNKGTAIRCGISYP
ncbi:MAG: hypothetical protein DSO08_00410 [Candidatus Methanomethylicota archaeon]|jgi:hypothetical protein|uniref:Uncharacterized protein n=1 Tax=Thermoproteota archaeon TaxID=2056631 RepID=A0A523BGS9_9CREN|nr:MAG: hypothetical protein DSO08_00410 [Candidatus Verstraetearchaeota archaeon]